MKPTAILLLYKSTPDISQQIHAAINREFNVLFVRYLNFGDTLNQDYLATLKADYLFSFNPVIIKKHVLDSIQVAAINFHTAPPRYPGRSGCTYALYNGDAEYGVTAHLMTPEIDAGTILETLYFPIDESETVETLHDKTLQYIPRLVRCWLERKSLTPNGEQWHGKARTQADLMNFMRICSPDEIERKIAACRHSKKPGPYIEIDGYRFWYTGA